MTHDFTDEDREKPVRTADGERIGTVTDVSDGRASVESDEGLGERIKQKLGWDDDSSDTDGDGRESRTHDLSDASIDRVDDEGVWIRQI